jgi:hypothetical protein
VLSALLARLTIARSDNPPLASLFGEAQPRHLLSVVGIPESIRSELEGFGCLIGTVPCVGGSLFALRSREFDGVIVRPELEEGLGVKLVRALKLGGRFPGLSEKFLEPLRQRVGRIPFWIAPFPGDDEYAVVLSSFVAVRRQREVPMAEAICRLKPFERREPAQA